jgi:shikimate dehydrogenase
VLHNAGYAALGLSQWTYDRREVTESELTLLVGDLDDSWRGLSLTMPLKEVAFEVATTVSEVATRAGSINTLTRRDDGGWDATNTDVLGIVRALAHLGRPDRKPDEEDPLRAALVLGSGATARSAVLALADLGVEDLQIAARNAATTETLAELGTSLGLAVEVLGEDDWAGDLPGVVVSTLPPAGAAVAAGRVEQAGDAAGATLLDVVYADWPTPLARAFAGADGEVISGLDMLVHQAAAQFELFTGQPAPVEAMFDAGRAALASR